MPVYITVVYGSLLKYSADIYMVLLSKKVFKQT